MKSTIYKENIPDELIKIPNWVGWREINLDGKISKIPIDTITHKFAKVNDSCTWGSFKSAVDIYKRRQVDGIGFVFSRFDPFVGVDLDNCFNKDGKLLPKVRRMVAVLDSYTEISPSGKGLHIIIKSTNKLELPGLRKPGFEVYPTGRFFTVTSKLFEHSKSLITERRFEIATYIREFTNTENFLPSKRLPANTDTCPLCFKFERTKIHSAMCPRHPDYSKNCD